MANEANLIQNFIDSSNAFIYLKDGEGRYIFNVDTALGFFDDESDPSLPDRHTGGGGGLPSTPKVSIGQNADDDMIFIKTSSGQLIRLKAPPRSNQVLDLIYWRQRL